MKIWIFCHCRNEEKLAGFFARHYSAFADEIHVFDDGSDDGTREIFAQYPKVHVHPISTGGLCEDEMLELAKDSYPMARGKADWAMWVDLDEFVHHPKIHECLAFARETGQRIVRPLGFNMLSLPLPADDGTSQLTDIYRMGVRAPIYSKPVVFDPSLEIVWDRGKHKLIYPAINLDTPELDNQPVYWRLKLFHFRYLTPDYARERNARQYDRVGSDKGPAWSCAPTWTGEHSPDWVDETMKKARDVVRDDAHYLPIGIDA